MMSRALGSKQYDLVKRSSAFGLLLLCCFCGILFSMLCTVFCVPLLKLLGADASTAEATGDI